MFQTTNQIIISDEKDPALLPLSNPAQPRKIIPQLSLWDIQQPRIDKEQTEDDRADLGSTNAASAERVAVCFFLWWVSMDFKRLKPISVEDSFFKKMEQLAHQFPIRWKNMVETSHHLTKSAEMMRISGS